MEWYRVRFVPARRILIWLLLETASVLLFPPFLELGYGLAQASLGTVLIMFVYSVALLYVTVVSEGISWYIAASNSELNQRYLPLLQKQPIKQVQLEDNRALVVYTDQTSAEYTAVNCSERQMRHLADFTVFWVRKSCMPTVPLRRFCRSCVKPAGCADRMDVADLAQSLNLFSTQAEKKAARSIVVYGETTMRWRIVS